MTVDEFDKAVKAYLGANPAYQGFAGEVIEESKIEGTWLALLKLEKEGLRAFVSEPAESMLQLSPKELVEKLAGLLIRE